MLLKIQNLTKTYKTGAITQEVLKGISLHIDEGAFVCIAGPSGSGKTTLLNIIGTLDKPDSGSMLFKGSPVGLKAEQFRLQHIGFIFQAYNLLSGLTALENVEYPLLLQKRHAVERLSLAKQVLDQVGLTEYIHKRPNQLSGGQQQRVAIARAIVSKPAIILADEPTANLDASTAEETILLMKKLNTELRCTFIFSTHDHKIIEKADHVYYLKEGLLEN